MLSRTTIGLAALTATMGPRRQTDETRAAFPILPATAAVVRAVDAARAVYASVGMAVR